MSNFDRMIVDSLLQDLNRAKDTKKRKEIIAEINEIRQKDMIKKCVVIGITFLIVMGIINGISQKFKSLDTEVFKTAAWYKE